MIRLLIFLLVIAFAAFGLTWLADNPDRMSLVWRGVEYRFSPMLGVGIVAVAAILVSVAWGLLRFVFRIPSLVSIASRARRREKGLASLSHGMIAIGAGDARAAAKHASQAQKLLGDAPLTKLLRAQAAQLSGDRPGAIAAFNEMLSHPETHGLGLRGLHLEARRSGDHEAALQYAARAHGHSPTPWAGQAVLDDRAARGDWKGALETVEANVVARLIDKPTANRWRAVLKTAIARGLAERDAKTALALTQEACRLAPNLVPAAALCGRLTAAQGDYRRASKIIETAYEKTPHPDLATAYVRIRHGDSAGDRLSRARALARVAPNDPESRVTIGRAALEANDLDAAREAIAPLIASGSRPTARVCLLMADIEETAGAEGAVREWLARAARAPRDKAWVADSIISSVWAPAGPNGKLDVFVWRTPDERLAPPSEADLIPPRPQPAPALPPVLAPALAPVLAPVLAPPAPTPAPAQPAPVVEAASIEPPRRGPPTLVVAASRPAAYLDPASTAPDDPGPDDAARPQRDYGAYAGG